MDLPTGTWDPAIHRGLHDMIRAHAGEGCVATFDWDNTSIRGDIGLTALDALDASTGSHHRARYDELDAHDAHASFAYCTEVFGGWREREVEDFAEKLVDDALADGRIAARPEVRDLMESLRAHDWDVWVVSASPRPLVQAFARRYGVSADRVCAQDLPVAGGVYGKPMRAPIFYRQGKVEVIDRDIRRRPTFAAGDSMSDFEMLKSARYGLVTAHEEQLTEAAGREGWWVQTGWR